MKTAIQEFNDKVYQLFSKMAKEEIKIIDFAKEMEVIYPLYLEKEKEQMNAMFVHGAWEALSNNTPLKDRIMDGYFENKAEERYNQKYQ